MALSSMTIATASPTGGSGWTTRHGQWRVGSQVRDWITDLHTGRTLVSINDYFGLDDGGVFIDVSYPGGGGRGANGAHFGFGFEVAGGGTRGISLVGPALLRMGLGDPGWSRRYNGLCPRYRVVGSLGQDDARFQSSGRDYAGSHSSGRGRSRRPGRAACGPSRSSIGAAKPATLIVAEDMATGPGRLVGTVTPSVAPAGATVEAVFALPAKDLTGWAIFVNPDPPDTGPLLVWTDVPLAGEIRITADGNPFWVEPVSNSAPCPSLNHPDLVPANTVIAGLHR